MGTLNSLAQALSYPRCSHNFLVDFFSAFKSLVVGLYLKIPHVPQENPQLSNPVDAVPNTEGRAAFLQMNTVQDVYLQIVYLFDIIDGHCIFFNVLMMTFGVIFESFFWQNFRFLFWTDGLMKWHFEARAKHKSQEVRWHVFSEMLLSSLQDIRDWLVPFGGGSMCILVPKNELLSFYQFSAMCFPFNDLCFPSNGKWWMHGEVSWMH